MKVAEIVGAKSELWTRFLPSAISDWSHADQSEYEPPSNIREIVETWLETSKETILRLSSLASAAQVIRALAPSPTM